MRAIETQYKGYRFRSRLEARWAVFFDALGIEWQYEPEGFEFAHGRYLPDFRLPSAFGDAYIEIKGADPKQLDIELCNDLAKSSGCCVFLFQGDPLDQKEWRFLPKVSFDGKPHTDSLVFDMWGCAGFPGAMADMVGPVGRAAVAARSARFEHGESGARK